MHRGSRYRAFLRGFPRAARLPPVEVLTMVHVGVVLVVVESLIRWVPVTRLSELVGTRLELGAGRPDAPPIDARELSPRALRQLRCIRRIADAWPLAKGPCLRRSLVAGHVLRRYHPAIRIGVGGTGDAIHAHAWLEIDGRPLEVVGPLTAFQHVPASRAG